jgi:cytochrome c oxidase subunit 1
MHLWDVAMNGVRRPTQSPGRASHLPMLWAIGGAVALAIGGLANTVVTRSLARILATNARMDGNSYFVVGHLHYALSLAMVFVFFAAWYYLFPKLTGYAYSGLLGKIHFWLLSIGVIVTLVPLNLLVASAVQQPTDVAEQFRYWALMARIGSYISAASTLVFIANMVLSLLRRRPAG